MEVGIMEENERLDKQIKELQVQNLQLDLVEKRTRIESQYGVQLEM
jgi:hypothetical protein